MTESRPQITQPSRQPRVWARTVAAVVAALIVLGLMALLINQRFAGDNGFASFSFAFVAPVLLSGLVTYIGDPAATRPLSYYLLVPVALVGLAIIAALAVLREGAICLVMLSPIWLVLGMAGGWIMRLIRKPRVEYDDIFRSPWFLAPVLALIVEGHLPQVDTRYTVTRSVEINATPARVWGTMLDVHNINAREGVWTVSQNIIGLIRPTSAVMIGQGVGAVRRSNWDHGVHFDEVMSDWQRDQRVAWRFRYDDHAIDSYADPHVAPNGGYLTVDGGGYSLAPLANGHTRLTISASYVAHTHVNAYLSLWGELLLGDIERNGAAIIKARAER